MLKSYEAIYDHGQLRWLDQQPPDLPDGARVLVVCETDTAIPADQARDIDALLEHTRGAWGEGKTVEEIDREIEEMRRFDWEREWDEPAWKPKA